MASLTFTDIRLATCDGPGYGLIDRGWLTVEGGRITALGAGEPPEGIGARQAMGGRLMTPALIDCHTHLVHGGDRAREFEMRLNGASYEDIARAGGGILSTVTATRAASQQELIASALPRVDALTSEGVTTIEVKSGYGLTVEDELKMLRAARALPALRPIRVVTSWLAAHATPPEYNGRPDAYIDEVAIPGLRAAHAEGLVDAVDGFCEGIAFDARQLGRLFDVAGDLGLPVKLHAEQLSRIGGCALVAERRGLSADHVEHATAEDARALAAAGSVATLLPGAFYALRETVLPPIAAFREAGTPMALATDCNPGTSPMTSPLLVMNMAATLFRLTPEEALRGVTVNAARALGLADCGRLAPGLRADLAVWDVRVPAELSYRIGFNPLYRRYLEGRAC